MDHVIGLAGGENNEDGTTGARSRARRRARLVTAVAMLALCVGVTGVAALIGTSGDPGRGRRSQGLASVRPASESVPARAQGPAARHASPARTAPRVAVTPSTAPADFYPDQYRSGTVLVGFRSGVTGQQRHAIQSAVGAYGIRQLGPSIKPAGHGRVTGQEFLAPYELRIPTKASVLSVVRRLRRTPGVAYAEPNYLETADAAPNDPSFPLQWGDSNTGQAIPTQNSEEELGESLSGTPGADDGALKAWKVTTGSRSVVIGEVDTGVDLTHPDLAANIWSNPGGILGCAAGTHGYNVVSKTCVPEDEDELYNGHGTHVAGILGAVGNNGAGVAGMNWQTTILPVKWMHGAGAGETSALIEAMQDEVLAKQEGVNVRIVNDSDSFFGTAKSEALENEIEVLGANNILFVTSAGNTGDNNDEVAVQRYPCSFDKPTEICVTASNNKDELPSWANIGPHTVQLAAPGVSIYSTMRENGYRYLTGGSMAAPQVSGAAALVLSVAPTLTAAQLKSDILEHVDKLPSMEGKVITGGRLDVCKAVPGCEHEITKAPSLEVAPTVSGTAQAGQTLTASTGEWSEEPFAYSYQWKRCNGRGELTSCAAISAATGQTYTAGSEDVGKTLRVAVTATNTKGSSQPAISEPQTAPVKPAEITFGKTSIGGTAEALLAERKRVSRYTLATAHLVQRLMVYLQPSGTSGQQLFKGVIYSDSSGKPETLLGVSEQLTFKSTNAPGWYELPFATPVNLGAGSYWIGFITGPTSNVADFRYDSVTNSRDYNSNAYASGPSNPFGTVSTDSREASLYAANTPLGVPVNIGLPTISGTAQSRQTLSATTGSWAESPTAYAYQWQRCNSSGEGCKNIEAATASTYTAGPADVGSTLRVAVTSSNATGASTPESSKQTSVVSAATPAVAEGKGPAISGKAEDGQTLTAENGTWTESPTSFSYQWQNCDSSGNNCKNIEKATASTYKLSSGEVGTTLKVTVTAKNAVGSSSPAVSAQTAVVAPAPPSVVEGKGPTISGSVRDGETVTATTGTWTGSPPITYSYQWQDCNALGEGCLSISGATASTYKLSSSEVGTVMKVIVTAKNVGGEGSATAKTPVVLAAPPHNVKPPEITGTPVDGETLGSSTGAWEGTPPLSYSYQWQRCNNLGEGCKNIEGASSPIYALGHSDVGMTVQVIVTAKNRGGEGTAAAKRTGVIAPLAPSAAVAPTIKGEAQDGQTLTAENGTWKGTPPITFTYQWERCSSSGEGCLNISGATSSTYVLAHVDVGATLLVVVTGTNLAGKSASGSKLTGVVAALAPSPEVGPAIKGEAKDEQTLTAENGTWSGTPTITYTYQWQRCDSSGNNCNPISGATSSTYGLTPADVGSTLKVTVTAKNTAGTTPATSPASSVVLAAPPSGGKPAIKGEARDEQTLSAENGEWKGTPTITYTYQWQRCDSSGNNCNPISGATSSTYGLTPADVGSTLKVTVTAKNTAGTTPATSPQSAVVAAAPPAVVEGKGPAIKGEARDEQTLSAENGTWKGTPTLSYTYQWQRCDSSGNNCNPISGATSSTYGLTPADVGSTLKVTVTAKNTAGTTPATSPAVGPVAPTLPAVVKGPSISGKAKDGEILTVENGKWSGTPPITFSYQWEDCNSLGGGCLSIAGATASAYRLTSKEVSTTLRVVVTAKNAAGEATSVSEQTALVAPAAPAGENPIILGKAEDGQTLSASSGSWEGTPPITFSYQWQRCDSSGNNCNDIEGATTPIYVIGHGDVGTTLRVVVTGKNAAGEATSVSAPTAVVLAATPTNVKLPAISGTPKDEQTLSAENGEWKGTPPITYTYQWQRCDSSGNNCNPISGASASTYKLTPADVGNTVKVTVTAKNTAGTTPATSPASAEVTAATPTNVKLPAISGTTKDEQTLSAENGEWKGTPPITYTYQWQRCDSSGNNCNPISGASASTYKLTPADVGNTVKVTVTAKNAAGTTPATSPASAEVTAATPTNVKLPAISGTTKDEQTLSAENGEWKGTPPITYTYQWQRCDSSGNNCNPISGASASTYKLTPADVGNTVKVTVTAKNTAGTTPATSPASAEVTAATPTNVKLPAISGTTKDEQTLSAENGEWKGTPPITYTYQWQRCDSSGNNCNPISGASASTYKLTPADVGNTVKVTVTAKNTAGTTPATSPASAEVTAATPTNVKLPAISGTTKDEQTLSAENGEWKGTPPITYTYQWQRCDSSGNNCNPISGASASTYKLTPADVGSTVKVTVTAKNTAGTTPATSPASAEVTAATPTNVKLPAISGTTKDEQTLSAENGEWKGTPPITYTYQWQRCDSSGNNCNPISGATEQHYTAVLADVGNTDKVTVTAKNAAGETPATSPASAEVTATGPANTELPQVQGTAQEGQTLTATNGEWEGTPPITYTYQWQRCDSSGNNCNPISGATEQHYTAVLADVGNTLKVTVTAKNAAGETSATSASAEVLPAPPVNTKLPQVEGITQDGKTLSATNGEWEGTPTITYTYQWQDCDALGKTAWTSPAPAPPPTS